MSIGLILLTFFVKNYASLIKVNID